MPLLSLSIKAYYLLILLLTVATVKATEHHLSPLAFIEEILMESRNFTRVDFCECVSIKHDDQIFFGDIKNLSLQGLFIKTPEKLPLSTPVEITFFFSRNSSMYLNANVVRCEDAGLGIQISGMDVKSFVHLRNVVSMQCNDHDLLMQETLKITNCIH